MPGKGKGRGASSGNRGKGPVVAGAGGAGVATVGTAEAASPGVISEPAAAAAGGSAGAIQGLFANPLLLIVVGLGVLILVAAVVNDD